jgi:predicted dehydrogenase
MTPVRLAIIGVGDVAQRDYLPEAARLGDLAEIAVVCGRHDERVRRVAEEYSVPSWTVDYREAINADVDAVVNLTPIDAHHDITLAALRAGRHVYTEKPLGLTARQARELRDEAVRRQVVVVAAPSVMLFPQVVRVRDLLVSGDLGTIRSAHAHAIAGPPPWPGYESDPSPFFAANGGPLIDMAVYPLHALTGLLGPARRVAALAQQTRDRFVIEEGPLQGRQIPIESQDHWQLLLEVPGCIASIEANFATAPSSAPECELRSDRAAVAFSLLDVSAPVRVLWPGADTWTDLEVAHDRAAGPDHILGVKHLAECVAGGSEPVAGADHAIHVLDVLEAAETSVERNTTVSIEAPTTWSPPGLMTNGGAS